MYALKELGITLLMALALTATATSQGSLTVTSGPLSVGQEASIQYSNPNKAGQVVRVEISDGGVNGVTQFVDIQLDESGTGSAKWAVPNWVAAEFNAPDAPGEARSIQP
jgi:hypothetical protein